MTNLVSSFLAETLRIRETSEDEDLKAEITSNVKVDIKVVLCLLL